MRSSKEFWTIWNNDLQHTKNVRIKQWLANLKLDLQKARTMGFAIGLQKNVQRWAKQTLRFKLDTDFLIVASMTMQSKLSDWHMLNPYLTISRNILMISEWSWPCCSNV